MSSHFLLHSLIALVQVILIDVTLAGDNAIVIGMAVRSLQGRQRRLAILIGTAFAAVLRIGLALLASRLLGIVGLTFAGGLLLLWVCWKMFRELRQDMANEENVEASPRLGPAVLKIVVADLSMSLDNVLAVAGASIGHPGILMAGLAFSVLLMGVAANFIADLLTRHKWIAWVGLLVVLGVALELIIRGGGELLQYVPHE
ncbi:TerC family protein [Gluconobacter wancherniae]|uniref:Membrane protein n=1 Tax=Gluconobacter wancherniae NBRC 103581 TaxID=656744 RepID=A0A511AYI3_9PROT|nr:TerC family protein [Gluconobacter wancherniae]MBF0853435.1 TerC family protein [Gluconobacter wancherniae]GBR66055.1 integral membrane protein TerC [Gluconobacter wancherniae NBRC 103581]GEK93265.1 membrane protein [Gluconobacter wancherniae NBRC 103581]